MYPMINRTVYCLFRARLDGDGYAHWNFVAVSDDIATLQTIVAEEVVKHEGRIHSFNSGLMTVANNYTIVANTKDVKADSEHLFDDAFGFVIQQEHLK